MVMVLGSWHADVMHVMALGCRHGCGDGTHQIRIENNAAGGDIS